MKLKYFFAAWLVWVVVWAAGVAAIVYVAVHFLQKYW